MAAEGFGAIMTGWVKANYVDVPFNFTFIGFEFLNVLIGPQAYVIYFLLGVAGLCIALGYRYRIAVAVYTILWAVVYFGQKTSYNNHYYLLLLVLILLNVIPAHVNRSVDVKQGRVSNADTVPFYAVWSIKFLLLIVYVYAAFAKVYPDWLDGTTVTGFLAHKADSGWAKELFTNRSFILMISYGGILFDLLVIPALWYKRTRKVAFIISIFFHLFNSIVFRIGIFPYMMLITSVLYFEPKTIRKLFFKGKPLPQPATPWISPRPVLTNGFLAAFMVIMLILPLRPWYFPGSSNWTEEGHRMSWRMMLRAKSGHITYTITAPTLDEKIMWNPQDHLPKKMARKVPTRPDMIWQYAQILREDFAKQGHDVEIYANVWVSLNGRPMARLIDRDVDLANTPWNYFSHNPWVLQHPENI